MALEKVQIHMYIETRLRTQKTNVYDEGTQEIIVDTLVQRQPTLQEEFMSPYKGELVLSAGTKRIPVVFNRESILVPGKRIIKSISSKPAVLTDEKGKRVVKSTDTFTLIDNPDYLRVKDEYLQLINSLREHDTDEFVGGMPVQLQKNCMSQLVRGTVYQKLIYGATLKADGLRNLLFLSRTGILYLIDRSLNIFFLRRPTGLPVSFEPTEFPFLFDGELVNHTGVFEFLIFDVIIYEDKGKLYNWVSNNYYDRLKMIDKATKKDLVGFTEFSITAKIWFPIETIAKVDDFYEYVKRETNKMRKKLKLPKLIDDGLILQPWDGNYVPFREWNVYKNVQFKWKPPDRLTIDAKLRVNPNNKLEWWLLTKRDQEYQVKQEDGQNVHAVVKRTSALNEKYKEGDIVECKLDARYSPDGSIVLGTNTQRNRFKIILKRGDKTEGNSLQTIMSTMSVVFEPFTLDILKPAIISVLNNGPPKDLLEVFPYNKLFIFASDIFFNKTEISAINNIYNLYFGIQDQGPIDEPEEPELTPVERMEISQELAENTELQEEQTQLLVNPVEFVAGPSAFGGGAASMMRRKETGVYELEFRIYNYIKKGRVDNIKKFTYYYLLDYFRKSGIPEEYTFSIDILESSRRSKKSSLLQPTYRSTYSDMSLKNPLNQVKSRVREFRSVPQDPVNFPMTFNLSLSTEAKSAITVGRKSVSPNGMTVYNKARVKHRNSFKYNLWQVDITLVITTNDLLSGTGSESYEVECEYIGGEVPFETFLRSMSDVYKTILFNSSYC
jgi:hypothetical protein